MKKRVVYLYILAAIFLPGLTAFGQKKRIIVYPEDVQNGQKLEQARPVTLGQFVEFYIDHGKESLTKKDGPLKITRAYRDDTFSYFTQESIYNVLEFIKVSNTELAKIDYTDIDGQEIKHRFIAEIIPDSDKQKAAGSQCFSERPHPAQVKTRFIDGENLVELSFKWKVVCGLKKVVNKTYSAKYDFKTKAFKDIRN